MAFAGRWSSNTASVVTDRLPHWYMCMRFDHDPTGARWEDLEAEQFHFAHINYSLPISFAIDSSSDLWFCNTRI